MRIEDVTPEFLLEYLESLEENETYEINHWNPLIDALTVALGHEYCGYVWVDRDTLTAVGLEGIEGNHTNTPDWYNKFLFTMCHEISNDDGIYDVNQSIQLLKGIIENPNRKARMLWNPPL